MPRHGQDNKTRCGRSRGQGTFAFRDRCLLRQPLTNGLMMPAMRFRVVITIALLLGVMALVYVAGRKSHHAVEMTNASADGTGSPTTHTGLKKPRTGSSFAPGDANFEERSPAVNSSNVFQRLMS